MKNETYLSPYHFYEQFCYPIFKKEGSVCCPILANKFKQDTFAITCGTTSMAVLIYIGLKAPV